VVYLSRRGAPLFVIPGRGAAANPEPRNTDAARARTAVRDSFPSVFLGSGQQGSYAGKLALSGLT